MVYKISKQQAKMIWIQCQKLNQRKPFGQGDEAVLKAVSHLGYVQIDTIHVIERCHHHILYNRIPNYRPSDLQRAQSQEKTVFEYWTHALSYIPTRDFKYFTRSMKSIQDSPGSWLKKVADQDFEKVKMLLKQQGPITIRDIKDDVLVKKTHPWGSQKPSKKALQLGFYRGDFVIAERDGMLKKYDFTERHFGWKKKPALISEVQYANYLIDRALRAQGLVTVDSICYLETKMKKIVASLLEKRLQFGKLHQVQIDQDYKNKFFITPEVLDSRLQKNSLTHILSPFDPLIIQRKRLKYFFDYEHLFEAYLPKEKRKFGYFSLPVLSKDQIIALLDLKTDRQQKKLLIQNWVWLEKHKNSENKKIIETELQRFEKFQLADSKNNSNP